MPGVDFFADPRSNWDIATIAGRPVKGTAIITGGAERALEIKKGRGNDGATMTDAGYQPADVSVTIRGTTLDDFEFVKSLIADIHPRKKGGARSPVTIEHPAANMLGIRRLYVKRVEFPTLDNGVMTFTFHCVEWFPEPKKAKPKKAVKGQRVGVTTVERPGVAQPGPDPYTCDVSDGGMSYADEEF